MLMELFSDWFEGRFNNRQQALNNPREAQSIIARHERTDQYQFYCSYSIMGSKFPYRELEFDMKYGEGVVFLTDHISGASLNFKHKGSTFLCHSEHRVKDKLYIYTGVLGEGFYKVNDQCYDSSKSLVRGLPNESFFDLKKTK